MIGQGEICEDVKEGSVECKLLSFRRKEVQYEYCIGEGV
jgi:hypothetical protein